MGIRLRLCCKYSNIFITFGKTWIFLLVYALRFSRWAVHFKIYQQINFLVFFAIKVRDYSGVYHVKLIPCTTITTTAHNTVDSLQFSPTACNPKEPIHFELPIRFQQVSDPVPAKYSLNTQFLLTREKEFWLSEGGLGYGNNSDAIFQPGMSTVTYNFIFNIMKYRSRYL